MTGSRPGSQAEALRTQVTEQLANFTHSTLDQNLKQLDAVRQVTLLDKVLHIELQLPFAWLLGFRALKQQMTDLLLTISGAETIQWSLQHQIAPLQTVKNQAPLANVKNIIAVSSCKGGVGKSTTAVNIALALAESGVRVGILDADIYGPSLPKMLGSEHQRPTSPDGKHMRPIETHGLSTNSIGYLMDEEHATIWRGPMASKALLQLLYETLWPDLDYLIIDMPPGTGDLQLTLAQNIPVTGAVVVTTPQDVALIDARKGIMMFNQVSVPVAGIVENMSYHICSQCGHQEVIFGSGGAQQLSEQQQILLLGQVPLHISLREDLDQGVPTVFRRPESEFSDLYRQIAEQISAGLYWRGVEVPQSIAVRNL